MTADQADDDDAPTDGDARNDSPGDVAPASATADDRAEDEDRAAAVDPDDSATGGADPDRVEDLAADLDRLYEKLDDLDREHAERDDLDDVREDLEDLEERVDNRTVHRDDLRSELRRYVRKRQRRGHATGWGPYLVLLYGTVMTVGAFYYLGDWPAIVAMFVIWLSTLGMYVFMLVVGTFLGVGRRIAGLRDLIGKLRG